MKFKHLYIALLLVVASSCQDFLEEEPTGFIAPNRYFNTEGEVEAAVYGVYDYLNQAQIAEYEWMLIGDLGTDVSVTRNIARYSFQYADMQTLPAEFITIWRQYYSAIGAANMVISRTQQAENLSEDFKKRALGEVKFLRGFFYHHLNLLWGRVPLWTDELDLDVVESIGNSTVEEVRAQVVQDLTDAAADLPLTVDQAGRATRWAAKGLLARVYLLSGQYQQAANLARDVIDNSGHQLLPNYADVFDWSNKMNSELIHVVPKAADIKGSALHSFSSPRPFDDNNNFEFAEGVSAVRPDGAPSTDKDSRNPGSLFQGWGIYQTLAENYNSFAPGDTRQNMWWSDLTFTDGSTFKFTGGGSAGLPGNSGYYNLKWIAWDEAPNNGGRDTHLQRLAELYLIFAEAENELNGPTAAAYEAINTVRRRAFGGEANDLAGLSQDEFRQAVIDENRWELGGEGLRRWYLWHWGYDTFKQAAEFVKESNPELVDNLQPHHVYFRIPDEEIIKNPSLDQNPGYN